VTGITKMRLILVVVLSYPRSTLALAQQSSKAAWQSAAACEQAMGDFKSRWLN